MTDRATIEDSPLFRYLQERMPAELLWIMVEEIDRSQEGQPEGRASERIWGSPNLDRAMTWSQTVQGRSPGYYQPGMGGWWAQWDEWLRHTPENRRRITQPSLPSGFIEITGMGVFKYRYTRDPGPFPKMPVPLIPA